MKKLLVAAVVVAAALGTAQADIGINIASGGVYGAGGDFTSGPWPGAGALYQVVWSPVAPGNSVDPSLQNPNEYIVTLATAQAYGYVNASDFGTQVIRDSDVFGGDANVGFVFTRLYMDNSPVEGGMFHIGPGVDASTLDEYDPGNPNTVFDYNSTGSQPGDGVGQQVNGAVIPEPATVALWGLGLLTIMVRRRIRG